MKRSNFWWKRGDFMTASERWRLWRRQERGRAWTGRNWQFFGRYRTRK